MKTSLPASAFKHLEPYPGGNWTVSGETADSVTVSYSYGGNAEVVSYTLRQCRTEQDVIAQCQSLMYNFESSDEKLADENTSESKEKAPQHHASEIELKIEEVNDNSWAPLTVPEPVEFFSLQQIHANDSFAASIQESQHVQQPTLEYTFNAVPCFHQQQLPPVYIESLTPVNSYCPSQSATLDIQGNFDISPEYFTLEEQQWIQ
ncbi:hypothetical protein IF1G_01098 [Cordyceps javanica]|uniref:Uncharacterized protein n=1 Tax=Cordyceps javanica TaxID=43265 RepID=A0A545VHG2_9HYPO|nr:hypothetical protein IF1G_01098 [Cordyceps javanica]TQW12323.1 hypothetical protein IF2G_01054 [Cordyceps javanica]